MLNKLRPVTHPVSETLPCELVKHIVDTLFPIDREEENSGGILNPFLWQEELKKKKEDPLDPGIYRPICLLNKAGKSFERMIVDGINRLLRNVGALSEDQFGFRAGRSTPDAILRLKRFVESHMCV